MRLPNKAKRVVLVVVGAVLILVALLMIVSLTHTPAPVRSPAVRIPLHERRGLYYVQVRIQGKEGWMVLDTGATATLLFQPALESLSYTPLQVNESVYLAFAGRRLDTRRVELPDVRFGEWHIPRLNALLIADTLNYREIDGLPVFGILGYDYLRQWRAVGIDSTFLTLYRHPVAPSPSARVFRFVEIGGLPAVSKQANQTPSGCGLSIQEARRT
jgi:hypothetical protein